jgi:hypothetical protein
VIEAMPRPRPPFLSREVTRHGRAVWYVRRDGKRIRLKSEFGTPEFTAEYQAVLAAHQPATEVRTTAGTLAWLIECFRGTAAWQARSASTRAKWDGLYRQVLKATTRAARSKSAAPALGYALGAPGRRNIDRESVALSVLMVHTPPQFLPPNGRWDASFRS